MSIAIIIIVAVAVVIPVRMYMARHGIDPWTLKKK